MNCFLKAILYRARKRIKCNRIQEVGGVAFLPACAMWQAFPLVACVCIVFDTKRKFKNECDRSNSSARICCPSFVPPFVAVASEALPIHNLNFISCSGKSAI
jgi:hypothetical protein